MFLLVVLEEQLEAVRREVTDLQRRLSEVEDQLEALEDGALAVFHVV
jgi:predicted nuclease with TOPRIM domain